MCQESLRYLLPLMGRKKVEVRREVFVWAMGRAKFEHAEQPDLAERLAAEGQGCLVLQLAGCWEGLACQNFTKSTTLMASKEELMRLRLLYAPASD